MSSENIHEALQQLEQLYVMRMLHERLRQQLEEAERFQRRQPQRGHLIMEDTSGRYFVIRQSNPQQDSDEDEDEEGNPNETAVGSAMRRVFAQRNNINNRSSPRIGGGNGSGGNGGTLRYMMDMFRLPQELEEIMMSRAIALSLNTVQPSTAPPPIAETDRDELDQRCLDTRLLKELRDRGLTECPVCQDDFSAMIGRSVCQLPCSHFFCFHCISKWLESSRTCPVCRMEMINVAELYQSPTKKKQAEEQRRVERLQAETETPRHTPVPPSAPPLAIGTAVTAPPEIVSGRRRGGGGAATTTTTTNQVTAAVPPARGTTPAAASQQSRSSALTRSNPPPAPTTRVSIDTIGNVRRPPSEEDDEEESNHTRTTAEQQQLLDEIVQRREQRRTSTTTATTGGGANPQRSRSTANSNTTSGSATTNARAPLHGRRSSSTSNTATTTTTTNNTATAGPPPSTVSRPAPGARLTVGRPRVSTTTRSDGNDNSNNNNNNNNSIAASESVNLSSSTNGAGVRGLLNRSRQGR